MKKLISLLLVLTMVLTLAACGGSDPTEPAKENNPTEAPAAQTEAPAAPETEAPAAETEAPATEASAASGTYTFTYGSTTIAMKQDTAEVLPGLGEPKKYTEEESCAFEGLSKTYFFGSFYLETYPDGDTDRVYCVWLVDDSVTTEEGIYIGASYDDVEAAYGAEYYNGKNAFIIRTADCILTIILENNAVTSIQYTAITE